MLKSGPAHYCALAGPFVVFFVRFCAQHGRMMGQTVFIGGCDKQVKIWPFGGTLQTVAMHDIGVSQVAWILEMNILVPGSWDKTLRCVFFL